MKRLLGALALLSLLLLSTPSYSQQATSICVQSIPPGKCFPVSATNPLPTTTGGGGGSNVTIAAPLGHSTADTAAVSVVPSATALFPSNISQFGGAALGAATAVGVEATGNVPTVNAHITAGGGGSVTQGTSPWVDSITQWGGGTLGAMANYGTSPGAVLVPGANAFVTNTVSSNTAQVNGVTTLTGAGATGTGAQRETVSQDTTTIAGSAPGTAGTPSANVVSVQGVSGGTVIPVSQASAYPAGAVPITASATGTTGATTATLTNVSGHTTYICGYSVRANATAATTVTDTITGVITGTMSAELWVAPNTSGIGIDENAFIPCIPASGASVSIAVVSGAPGTGGLVSVRAWGYSL
jgi:hypothetical protein